MRFQTRLFLAIVGLLVVTVATALGVTSGASQAMVSQTGEDGIAIGQMLASSANFAASAPNQVEDIVGDQTVCRGVLCRQPGGGG